MSRREPHLRVNPILCDAYGHCAELLPELITLDEWGYPIIADGPVPATSSAMRAAPSHCARGSRSCSSSGPPTRSEPSPSSLTTTDGPNVTDITAPPPGALAAVTQPPCASAACRTIASPRPEPGIPRALSAR